MVRLWRMYDLDGRGQELCRGVGEAKVSQGDMRLPGTDAGAVPVRHAEGRDAAPRHPLTPPSRSAARTCARRPGAPCPKNRPAGTQQLVRPGGQRLLPGPLTARQQQLARAKALLDQYAAKGPDGTRHFDSPFYAKLQADSGGAEEPHGSDPRGHRQGRPASRSSRAPQRLDEMYSAEIAKLQAERAARPRRRARTPQTW